jgi:hypothetical protein
MITTTGAALQIDTVHARAICDEIGERLRTMLRVQISREPPPRLKELMQQLAGLDEELAPSIVPSDVRTSRDQQPVKRGSGPSCISFR